MFATFRQHAQVGAALPDELRAFLDGLGRGLSEHLWELVIYVVIFLAFYASYKLIKRGLTRKAKSKKQLSNVLLFLKIVKYVFVFFYAVAIISIYFGSSDQWPIIIGFLSVAMGLALQNPITSILAWLIIVTRRPFNIGDRILVGTTMGDIDDITITHIFLLEVGGTVDGEERSGRDIILPNSIIFERDIVNYTTRDDYILDEVVTSVTYESDVAKAEALVIDAADRVLTPYITGAPPHAFKKPHTRLKFRPSGIDVAVRYHTPALRRNEIATAVTREIFSAVRRSPDVEIAYPHTEVVFREKERERP
jgi:small-conductance mechanosensitive channel